MDRGGLVFPLRRVLPLQLRTPHALARARLRRLRFTRDAEHGERDARIDDPLREDPPVEIETLPSGDRLTNRCHGDDAADEPLL